jgi:1,4-dihydroxy-2-naphthoyl-CoA hydrolase
MTIEELNKFCENSFVDHLGIRFTEFDGTHIKGYIEITSFHYQPVGFVHGGVYLSFAETMAGAGSSILVEKEGKIALGNSVNSQHLASANKGKIVASGKLIFKSTTKHIWDVEISDKNGKLISISRVTNSIKDMNANKE